MNRREFLKGALAGAAILLLPPIAKAYDGQIRYRFEGQDDEWLQGFCFGEGRMDELRDIYMGQGMTLIYAIPVAR